VIVASTQLAVVQDAIEACGRSAVDAHAPSIKTAQKLTATVRGKDFFSICKPFN
jgi:hypothetical protein